MLITNIGHNTRTQTSQLLEQLAMVGVFLPFHQLTVVELERLVMKSQDLKIQYSLNNQVDMLQLAMGDTRRKNSRVLTQTRPTRSP